MQVGLLHARRRELKAQAGKKKSVCKERKAKAREAQREAVRLEAHMGGSAPTATALRALNKQLQDQVDVLKIKASRWVVWQAARQAGEELVTGNSLQI